MKSKSNHLSTTFMVLWLSAGFLLTGCREQEPGSSPARAIGKEGVSAEIQAATEEEIAGLRRAIDSGKQGIEDLDAFVEMERAKLTEDPEYEKTFLLEALDEQEQLKEQIETGEERLEELIGPKK